MARPPPNPAYAPASPTMWACMAVMWPSSSNPISMYWICERPCGSATMFSDRVSTQRTGRPSRRPMPRTARCSAAMPALPPNAADVGCDDPHGFLGQAEQRGRQPPEECGICVETYTVSSVRTDPSPCSLPAPTPPPAPLPPGCPLLAGMTEMALPSIGTTAMRWLTNRPRRRRRHRPAARCPHGPADPRRGWIRARRTGSARPRPAQPPGRPRPAGLVVDEHGLGGVLGLGHRLGHDGDDRFAHEADLLSASAGRARR